MAYTFNKLKLLEYYVQSDQLDLALTLLRNQPQPTGKKSNSTTMQPHCFSQAIADTPTRQRAKWSQAQWQWILSAVTKSGQLKHFTRIVKMIPANIMKLEWSIYPNWYKIAQIAASGTNFELFKAVIVIMSNNIKCAPLQQLRAYRWTMLFETALDHYSDEQITSLIKLIPNSIEIEYTDEFKLHYLLAKEWCQIVLSHKVRTKAFNNLTSLEKEIVTIAKKGYDGIDQFYLWHLCATDAAAHGDFKYFNDILDKIPQEDKQEWHYEEWSDIVCAAIENGHSENAQKILSTFVSKTIKDRWGEVYWYSFACHTTRAGKMELFKSIMNRCSSQNWIDNWDNNKWHGLLYGAIDNHQPRHLIQILTSIPQKRLKQCDIQFWQPIFDQGIESANITLLALITAWIPQKILTLLRQQSKRDGLKYFGPNGPALTKDTKYLTQVVLFSQQFYYGTLPFQQKNYATVPQVIWQIITG